MDSEIGFNRFRILTVVPDLKRWCSKSSFEFADEYYELDHDSKVLA